MLRRTKSLVLRRRNDGGFYSHAARSAFARHLSSPPPPPPPPPRVQQELRVFLVAGEPSGDVIGARLMTALKRQCPVPIAYGGVGGSLMEREGLVSEFSIDDLAIMGTMELIPHLLRLRARLHQTVIAATKFCPHIVIAIDSKGFSFRVFKHLRAKYLEQQQTCPLNVLYVAPSAWALKRGEERLKTWAGVVDHILCILPFEEPLCRANGLPTTFVGHPVVEDAFHDASKAELWTSNWHIRGCKDKFYREHGLSQGSKLLSVLPGSRKQEVKRMLPIYKEALEALNGEGMDLTAVIPTALGKDLTKTVESIITKWDIPVVLLPEASLEMKYDAFAASTAGLCTSGSAVLQMQLARLPCVVAYRANILTEWIIKRSLRLKYMSLPNILLDSPIVPEAALSDCTPDRLALLLRKLIQDEALRATQVSTSEEVLSMLVPRSLCTETTWGSGVENPVRPSFVAANKVLNLLGVA